MNSARSRSSGIVWRWIRALATMVVCVAILGAAAAAVVWINRTEPTAQKANSSRKSSALVETVTVHRGTFAPRLVVLGTVQAARDVVLSPRVSGQVLEIAPGLVPGGKVRKDELLLRIDPADFEIAVSVRQSELAQAEASQQIEQARQKLAEQELQVLEGSIESTNLALVMREPQIASIAAEVAAAEAQVERAKLDLERSQLYAPFDAQVMTRSVNVGSQVRPGDELARIVGVEEFWVMAAVPVRSLRWVQFPQARSDEDSEPESDDLRATADALGSRVILRNPEVWGPDAEREARVARMVGALDRQTRLARVLIVVKDPLGESTGNPPLILDSLIETEIEGRPIENVVRLDRRWVRDQDTVWVMKDNKLEIRDVEIEFRDLEYAYVSDGLEAGEEVVMTTLATVAEGIGLRKENSTESDSPGDAPSSEEANSTPGHSSPPATAAPPDSVPLPPPSAASAASAASAETESTPPEMQGRRQPSGKPSSKSADADAGADARPPAEESPTAHQKDDVAGAESPQ